jgi:hypothetical protein
MRKLCGAGGPSVIGHTNGTGLLITAMSRDDGDYGDLFYSTCCFAL